MSSEDVSSLTPGQHRRSLGEVKKREDSSSGKGQRLVRSTVLIPGEIEWPDLSEDGAKKMLKILERLSPKLVFKCGKPTLEEIRTIEKELRREYRAQWKQNDLVQNGFLFADHLQLRSSVVIGINTCMKALECEKLKALLIEKDADPPIITRALIPVALAKNVPIFAISGLNNIVHRMTNIRCLAFGLKENCSSPSHHFYPLYDIIMKYHADPFPPVETEEEILEKRKQAYLDASRPPEPPPPSKKRKMPNKKKKANYLETQMRNIFHNPKSK